MMARLSWVATLLLVPVIVGGLAYTVRAGGHPDSGRVSCSSS